MRKRFNWKAALAVLGLAAGVALPTPTIAAEATLKCGGIYSVVKGDTLREIAAAHYGDSGNYQLIFSANRDVVRRPALIEIGEQLFIPCTDGRGPASKIDALAAQGLAPGLANAVTPAQGDVQVASVDPSAVSGSAATVREFQPTIRFLTGSGFAPFTDEDLREGGMITDLINRAMHRADSTRDYQVTFVNDWGPHLNVLLRNGGFDLGFPWYKPDCSKIDKLSEPMQMRCNEFDFSHGFYEVVIGFYTRQGEPFTSAADYTSLMGKTICRPRGYFTFDLEQQDLKEPNITMKQPATPADCFEMLMKDEVDVVSINVLLGEDEIQKQDLSTKVAEIPELSSIQTLHALSAKSNPYGRTYLSLINKGLREMRGSGEWFSVVSQHLAEHAAR